MNSILKNHPRLIGLVIATALSFGASSGIAWAADGYRFEQVRCVSGDSVAVRLVDTATGRSVTNAQVFAVHRQWLPGKGAPNFIERKIALTPDGEGRFTYEGGDVQSGANIKLVAQLDGTELSGSTTIC